MPKARDPQKELERVQQRSLSRLMGQPLPPEDRSDPELLYLTLLERRIQELSTPNPYRTDFVRFATELCYTRDEARAGRVAPIPAYPYLAELADRMLRYSPLLIDKARRQLVTWWCLAFDLWLIGGGYDAQGRWPALMPTPENPDGGNRRVIIAARKLEDANGSADFLSRIGFIYDQFEERGLREKWPDFPTIRFSYARAVASNGGEINAVPQGKHQLAGAGVTQIHAEEFSRWDEQTSSLGSALQTLQGSGGMPGGHIFMPCTAQAETHAAHIVLDKIAPLDAEAERRYRLEAAAVAPGNLPLKRTRNGFWVIGVPWNSRPDFDFKAACVGMSPSEIQTDLLRNWLASSGVRVYDEFREEIHVSKEPLEYDPDLPLHVGLDFGLSPAAAICQLSAFGQLLMFPSLHPDAREYSGIYEFGQRLADHLLREYAAPNGMTLEELPLVIVGDPAGRAKVGHMHRGKKAAELMSCAEVLFRGLTLEVGVDEEGHPITEKLPGWGWRMIPGDVSHKKRQEAVRYRLRTLIHGEPAFLLDVREEFMRSAFLGGYHRRERSDGTIEPDPEKNEFSHLANALEYLMTRVSARPARRDPDEDTLDPPPRPAPFASQASSAWRHG